MTIRRRCGATAMGVGCLLVVLGGGSLLRSEAPLAAGGVAVATGHTAPAGHPLDAVETAAVGTARTPARQAPAADAPALLRLIRLRVSARVVGVPVHAGGALGVPADPRLVGWWQAGARPGGGRGSIVVDGHVDDAHLGEGALFTLRMSRPGDAVRVRDASGRWWKYVVSAVRRYSKRSLPADRVFAQGGPERLVLVTCGGAFDRRTRQYADNVVVFAVPASGG